MQTTLFSIYFQKRLWPSWVAALRSQVIPLLLLLASAPVMASPVDSLCFSPNKEFVKNLNREFNTSAYGTTAIYNKHGDVLVHTWDENKVKINVSITVNATDQKEADKVLAQLNVNFINTNGYVKAETMIGDVKCASLQDFKFNYEVWMPVNNQLDLVNKYGNTALGNLNGNLIANVKYGELKVGKLQADANLKMDFCTACISSVQNVYGWANNGGLILDNAKLVQMETEHSSCTFRRVEDLRLTSRFDNIDVGVAGNVRLQIKYGNAKILNARTVFLTAFHTSAKIENLNTQLDADMQSGGLEVVKIFPKFDRIVLSGLNSAIVLDTQGIPFCYDITGNNTSLNLRNSKNVDSTAGNALKVNNIVNGCFTRQGCLGDTNTRSKITAKMNFGALVIK